MKSDEMGVEVSRIQKLPDLSRTPSEVMRIKVSSMVDRIREDESVITILCSTVSTESAVSCAHSETVITEVSTETIPKLEDSSSGRKSDVQPLFSNEGMVAGIAFDFVSFVRNKIFHMHDLSSLTL